MKLMRNGFYLFVLLGISVVLSGCHSVVRDAEKIDKAVYDEIPKWM